jgi:hypothetical protein
MTLTWPSSRTALSRPASSHPPAARAAPAQVHPPTGVAGGDACLADALWYATTLGWPVLPVVLAGHSPAHPAWPRVRPAAPQAGPGAAQAPEAGRTPERLAGSTNPRQLRRWWATWRGMPAALSTGGEFEIVDVPAAAGRAALRRWSGPAPRQPRPGPVALTSGGRMWLFVAAGAREDLPGLLDWLDWADVGLDLHVHGLGHEVLAPVRPGAPGRGAVPRWLIAPAAASSAGRRPLPELHTLINPLAHACHRHQLMT